MDILDFVKDCYVEYGRYVNANRLIPDLRDGLLPVHRRLLLSAPATMERSVKVESECLARYHPHGMAPCSSLVIKGLLSGDGQHGSYSTLENIPPAAPRYTSASRSKNEAMRDIIYKYSKFVPHFENDLGNSEAEFLPMPVPSSLIYGHMGIGLGVATRIPAFSVESLIEAREKGTKGYAFLRGSYGIEILPEKSDLRKLWREGKGRVTYRMDVTRDGDTVILKGDGSLFKPRMKRIYEEVENGRLILNNLSDTTIHLEITRAPRVRTLNNEQIFNMVRDAATYSRMFTIVVVGPNQKVSRVGVRHWLDFSWKTYLKYFKKYTTSSLNNVQYRRDILNLIPKVAKLLNDGLGDNEIKRELNIQKPILDDIKGRPIRILRKTDFDIDLKVLDKEESTLKKADPEVIARKAVGL